MITQLKLERLRAGETQSEAASRVGISVALFRELEAGRARPSDRVAGLLERTYRVATSRLLRQADRRIAS